MLDTKKKLAVAFIWHMHQPFYKDSSTGKYLLPWVRLHAVKDYFPMALIAENFDNLKMTFNLVPSLIEQIQDYVEKDSTDRIQELTMMKATSLSMNERLEILDDFFRVNFKRFIEPNPRYTELLIKRGVRETSARALRNAIGDFDDRDFLDLQVLFNLSWFHSISIDEDINLKDLKEKGNSYTEEDKEYIMSKQKEIMGQIIPLYKRLQDSGRIELTTTPFYHPILPLLCDTSIAKVSSPSMKLPREKFSHSEDAAWQIGRAIEYHKELFGLAPLGMWPSELSVSTEVLEIMMSKGVKWIAADEEVLFKTLSMPHGKKIHRPDAFDRRLIYEPYKFKRSSRQIACIFRDKNLSDMISFSYNSWEQAAAADDLVGHFKRIAENLRRDADKGLVTIAMDGENAWEYYEDNGRRFFEVLYSNLDRCDDFCSTTISEYLELEPPKKSITDIFPGSWINHNFNIWIGEEQDNVSWGYLERVRRDLVKYEKEIKKAGGDVSRLKEAWRQLYIAEGSDWNWWYSGKARTGKDSPFDKLYRLHLKNVYKFLGRPIPDFLKISIA